MFWPVVFGGIAYAASGRYGLAIVWGVIGGMVWYIRCLVSANTSPMTPWGRGLLY